MNKNSIVCFDSDPFNVIIEPLASKLATVFLQFPGGDFYETDSNAQISHICEHFLASTPSRFNSNSRFLKEYLMKYNVRPSGETFKDRMTLRCSSSTKSFRPALDLMFDNLTKTKIEDIFYEQAKNTVYSEMGMYCDDPNRRAIDLNNKTIFKHFRTYKQKELSIPLQRASKLKSYINWTLNSRKIVVVVSGGVSIDKLKDYFAGLNVALRKTDFKPTVFNHKFRRRRGSKNFDAEFNPELKLVYSVTALCFPHQLGIKNYLMILVLYKIIDKIMRINSFEHKYYYKYDVGVEFLRYNSLIKIYLNIRPETFKEAYMQILEDLNKVLTQKDLFTSAVNYYKKAYRYPSIIRRSRELALFKYYDIELLSTEEMIQAISDISFEDLRELFAEIISKENFYLSTYGNFKW